ncbi:uncharacterized protein EI97DRAFT_376669 [Westerdykella ornata]|uniref:Uncharacterized protein n=1 Tax=Westerdykella ornata TaxID=318751 RepID=A0A6A6JLD5_WESOR|nr:uncharacterized protein EI97DRAFT_376669 [Westerdykella ornata]KAF2276923.1 hypothetical protein EI97DRAFT_376669 [Westerdykella ornata]
MDRSSLYESDVPSLSASLEAFEHAERGTHSTFGNRSAMQSSSRWSAQDASESSEPESDGPWAPPAWQRSSTTNDWYRKSLLSESATLRSSHSPSKPAGIASSRFNPRPVDREITPSRIPLPESPLKMTPRTSPDPVIGEQETRDTIAERMQSPPWEEKEQAGVGPDEGDEGEEMMLSHHEDAGAHSEDHARPGYVNFSVRAETLFRTGPLEDLVSAGARALNLFTQSRLSILCTIGTIILAYVLTLQWTDSLIPDIANVANMARQFEPLMFASENVIPRSRELADASIAVQDLGESVRATNMSASTIIIEQLTDLGDSLSLLSDQLRSFFTNVDADMDSILLAMEWTKRELETLQGPSPSLIDNFIGNLHGALSKTGLLEDGNGQTTAVGRLVTDMVGQTTQQRNRATLQRTFDYLLSTLEENITNELSRADSLYALFETVDRQFQNLHRSVAKEEDSLSSRKDEFLARMWRQSIKNKMQIKKYEKNLKLLKTVRASTLENKSELKAHVQVINSVKDQLDKARKNLISPLIRRAQSSGYGVEQQLVELQGTYRALRGVREGQKMRVYQAMFRVEPRRRVVTIGEEEGEGE